MLARRLRRFNPPGPLFFTKMVSDTNINHNKENEVSIETLHELFSYDPETGVITPKSHWHASRGNKEAGSINGAGYRQIMILGRLTMAHRIAWAMYYGEWPKKMLDHKNRVKSDNRIENLQESNKSKNAMNAVWTRAVSGYRGVFWTRKERRWDSKITVRGKVIKLGLYQDLEEAAGMRLTAEMEFFGTLCPTGEVTLPTCQKSSEL